MMQHFGADLVTGSLAVHGYTQHIVGVGLGEKGQLETLPLPPEDDPQTYWMYLSSVTVPKDCPVQGCRGVVVTRLALRVNLLHHNVRYTVVILL